MTEIIQLFKEVNLLVALLIVLVTIILLGSFRIEFSDGRFRFVFQWPGLKNRQKKQAKNGDL